MQIKQITVTYSYTFNLGNYSSIRPEVSLTADLAEGDEPEQARRELLQTAQAQVEESIDHELIRLNRHPHFDPERTLPEEAF